MVPEEVVKDFGEFLFVWAREKNVEKIAKKYQGEDEYF